MSRTLLTWEVDTIIRILLELLALPVSFYEYGRKTGDDELRMHPCPNGKRTTTFELFDQYKDGKLDAADRDIFQIVPGHTIRYK